LSTWSGRRNHQVLGEAIPQRSVFSQFEGAGFLLQLGEKASGLRPLPLVSSQRLPGGQWSLHSSRTARGDSWTASWMITNSPQFRGRFLGRTLNSDHHSSPRFLAVFSFSRVEYRRFYNAFTRPALTNGMVRDHLKYLAWAQGRSLAWSSAPRHLGSARALSRRQVSASYLADRLSLDALGFGVGPAACLPQQTN
jgi:hypothetical protein